MEKEPANREGQDPSESAGPTQPEALLSEPPPNPAGGRTLIVDRGDPAAYERPSAALKEASPHDQVFVRPGIYEDKIFVTERPIILIGAGRNHVQIFSRRGGPLYLQGVPTGRIAGVTFRYVGSDQHSAINVLDSACTIAGCRATEGVLSGIVVYGPHCRPTLMGNEVCYNRESGIFVFAGARPYLNNNECHSNHHFGIAVRDLGSGPDLMKNRCHSNMLSGILLFYHAQALLLDNVCRNNQHWGIVTTPECQTSPPRDELAQANRLDANPRGPLMITHEPLAEIGR